jgi:hypothetical protein
MQLTEKSYSHQLVRTGNMPRPPEGLARGRMPWLPKEEDALIVDVGCAWGTLLLELRQLGYQNLLGIEVDEELAAEAGARCASSGEAIRIVRSDAIEFFENTDLVADLPNMSSITGANMQCSDLTHATAFTEFSLKQLLDNAGYENVSVICIPPALRPWRIGQQGSGIAWHLNWRMHSMLYSVTNSGPRPNCFCPALLVTAR